MEILVVKIFVKMGFCFKMLKVIKGLVDKQGWRPETKLWEYFVLSTLLKIVQIQTQFKHQNCTTKKVRAKNLSHVSEAKKSPYKIR